jgi:hypothetical protein
MVASRFLNHFIAIFFRRLALIKRSLRAVVTSLIGTLVFSFLAIIAQYLMKTLMTDRSGFIEFTHERMVIEDLAMSFNQSDPFNNRIKDKLGEIYEEDIHKPPKFQIFDSRKKMNE